MEGSAQAFVSKLTTGSGGIFSTLGVVKIVIMSIITIIVAGIMITVSSIGIECYNKNKDLKNKKKGNFSFLVGALIVGIILVLISIGVIIFRIYTKVHSGY